jgi:predicted small secreted protein
LIALLVLAGVVGLAGCNTMRGMGQDIETAGDKLEHSAERNKKY